RPAAALPAVRRGRALPRLCAPGARLRALRPRLSPRAGRPDGHDVPDRGGEPDLRGGADLSLLVGLRLDAARVRARDRADLARLLRRTAAPGAGRLGRGRVRHRPPEQGTLGGAARVARGNAET